MLKRESKEHKKIPVVRGRTIRDKRLPGRFAFMVCSERLRVPPDSPINKPFARIVSAAFIALAF